MAKRKQTFQFTLMHLVLAVIASALLVRIPPIVWLLRSYLTFDVAFGFLLALVFITLLSPMFVYWRVVCWFESRHPKRPTSNWAFAIGGGFCFLLGGALLVGMVILLNSL